METIEPAKFRKITIIQDEGPKGVAGVEFTFEGLGAELRADEKLSEIASGAPTVGYYKTVVRIELESDDPEDVVMSRHDIQRGNQDGLVREHVLRWLKGMANQPEPLRGRYTDESRAWAQRMYDRLAGNTPSVRDTWTESRKPRLRTRGR